MIIQQDFAGNVKIKMTNFQDSAGNVQYPTVVLIIEMIDNFVVIFFTIEFVIRLLVCPNKIRQLILSYMSVINKGFWDCFWN